MPTNLVVKWAGKEYEVVFSYLKAAFHSKLWGMPYLYVVFLIGFRPAKKTWIQKVGSGSDEKSTGSGRQKISGSESSPM